jgi:nickel/cobalt transporter (NicO) family protein
VAFSLQPLLIGAVAAVGVLHTVVPDHWLPITVITRQRGWSRAEAARAAFQAGIGHVLSMLTIAFVVWLAGIEVAKRFGAYIDTASSIALIGFGLWVTAPALHDLDHHHSHSHDRDGMQFDQFTDSTVDTSSDRNKLQASRTA